MRRTGVVLFVGLAAVSLLIAGIGGLGAEAAGLTSVAGGVAPATVAISGASVPAAAFGALTAAVAPVSAPAAAPGSGPSSPSEPAFKPPAPLPDDASLLQGFLPKEDLGVLVFLKEHPEADGRGIIVAILDTGVELEHPALQTTSTGSPKIIDVFDGTDNGFVPLPLAAKIGTEPTRGLTGRVLRLPADLPAGTELRLGVIVGCDYFPGGLSDRRTGERRAAWQRARENWDAANAQDEGDHAAAIREAFEKVIQGDADPGDLFDVAAIRRGEGWEVRIDTDADGDLTDETPLRPYREHREIAHFGDPIRLAVALERIAPDGSSLFLFFDEGGHGTHVAGIVGGFYGPGDPLNGLAPGVQFLAAKIGNGRFGGSTSHNAMLKAAQWAVDSGADVINISFGGDTFFDDGREIASVFLNELVQKTGVVICSSAGNEGPALSTIGSPGSARRIFGWGASISMKTQQTNYGTLDPRRDEMFHFSSRGPLLNGDPGIDFISPGAALSTLPTWLLLKGESWNGTSMASPQGAGFCSLILSAARQAKLPVTPARLRRAMRIGARPLPGILVIEQGDGIPQALPTLEALRALATCYPAREATTRVPHDLDARDPVVDWVVTVHNATGWGGGYYERDLREKKPYRVAFDVRPDFPSDSLQAERAGFLRIVRLQSEAPWMRAPLEESLHSAGSTISVEIDPSKLAPGLNVGRVIARDVARPEAGFEFALVATVIVPEEVDPSRPIREGTWDFLPGDRLGTYLRVPAGATLAHLRVREQLADPANNYVVALSDPDLIRKGEDRVNTQYFALAAGEEYSFDLHVLDRTVLELVAFSRWRENRAGRLAWRIEFEGVGTAVEPPLSIDSDRPGAGFVLGAPSWNAEVRFDASLDRSEEPLEVDWRVFPDTLFTKPLNGIPAVVEEGRAFLRADDGEDLTIDLRVGPEFEDFLDDSFFRIYDDSGREVAHDYVYDGTATFHAPHAGTYRILFSLWARGTRLFDETTVISPVVLRSSGPHELKVHRNPVDGFRNGPDSLDSVQLVAGERRRFFLRAEDLPEDQLLRGSLRILGRNDAELARVPVVADTRAMLPSAEDRLSESVDAAVGRAQMLAGRTDLSGGERDDALERLALCERLRSASPEPAKEEKRGKKKEEEDDSPPPDALWDIQEARMGLLLGGAGNDPLKETLEQLRKSLPTPQPDEPEVAADRRRKEAVVEEFAGEIAMRSGDLKEARACLDRSRNLDPDLARSRRLDALVLFGEEKWDESRKRADAWLADHPDDSAIDSILIRSLIKLGWLDLAALRLEAWPRLHPRAVDQSSLLRKDLEAALQKTPQGKTPFPLIRS